EGEEVAVGLGQEEIKVVSVVHTGDAIVTKGQVAGAVPVEADEEVAARTVRVSVVSDNDPAIGLEGEDGIVGSATKIELDSSAGDTIGGDEASAESDAGFEGLEEEAGPHNSSSIQPHAFCRE